MRHAADNPIERERERERESLHVIIIVRRIERLSRPQDKRTHPILGDTFRVLIIKSGQVAKRGVEKAKRGSKRSRTMPGIADEAAGQAAEGTEEGATAAGSATAATEGADDGDDTSSSSSSSSSSDKKKKKKKKKKKAKKAKKEKKKASKKKAAAKAKAAEEKAKTKTADQNAKKKKSEAVAMAKKIRPVLAQLQDALAMPEVTNMAPHFLDKVRQHVRLAETTIATCEAIEASDGRCATDVPMSKSSADAKVAEAKKAAGLAKDLATKMSRTAP